jgi:hypothetical protein
MTSRKPVFYMHAYIMQQVYGTMHAASIPETKLICCTGLEEARTSVEVLD